MRPTEVSRDELSRLVYTDDLTGLYNRRYMYHYLTQEVPWQGEHPESLALIMLDLDAFKAINDNYGHLEGDSALKQTAAVLKDSFESPHVVIRYAGDEFSVLLPRTDRKEALDLAERVRSRLEQTEFDRAGQKVKGAIHFSAGVAMFPEDARTAEELIGKADKALYYSKLKGKNKVSDVVQMEKEKKEDMAGRFPLTLYTADQDQVAEIVTLSRSIGSDQAHFVLVKGRLGIGKIRFLGELIKQLEAERAICVLEQCSEHEIDVPYRPLIELLDKYLYKNISQVELLRQALSEPELVVLSHEVPTLGKAGLNLPAAETISPQQQRLMLFDALCHALSFLAQDQLLCVILDSFQFVDEGTLDVVKVLLRECRGRMILCGALELKPGEDEVARPLLNDFVEQAGHQEKIREVILEPLSQKQIADFISQILPGREAAPEFDRLMWEISQGSRLYTEIAIQVMIAKKVIRYQHGTWQVGTARREDLPASLDELVRSQITLLDKQTEEIITEAAVIGTNFRLDLLKRVAGTNEGEMLDLLDKARQMRLVDSPQKLNDDELHFVSPQAQQVTYDRADAGFIKSTHEHVAEAVEELYEDRLDQAAAELAHHYDKAGNQKKAEEFQSLAQDRAARIFDRGEITDHLQKKGQRVHIKEHTADLSEKDQGLVMHVLRTINTASKNLLLYPEGSQAIHLAIKQLQEAVDRALERVDGFTVGGAKEGLRINGKAVDAKVAGVMADELLRTMRERHIQSITFVAGVNSQELLAFVKQFGQPPPKGVIGREHWAHTMEQAGIEHIGIVQRAYVLETQRIKDTAVFLKGAGKTVSEDTVVRAAATLRSMNASIENMKLYPAESSIIVYAIEQLERSLSQLFTDNDGINFSEVDGTLLINGVQGNPKILGNAGKDFARVIHQAGIKSCAIVREVTMDELRTFLKALGDAAAPKKIDEWRAMLAAQNVAHIWVGDTLYTSVGAAVKSAPPPPPPKPAHVDTAKLTTESALLKAREYSEYDPEKFFSAGVVAALPHILEILVLDRHQDWVETLIEKLSAQVLSPDAKLRERAADAMAEVYEKSSTVVQGALLPLVENDVIEALRNERSPAAYRRLIQIGSHMARHGVEKKNYDAMNRVVWAMGRQRMTEDAKRELGGMAKEALTQLLDSSSFQSMLRELETAESETQDKILNILAGFGTAAVPTFIKLTKEMEDYSIRRFAARAIRASGAEGVNLLLKEINRFTPADPCRRMIGILDEMGTNVVPLIKEVIAHPDEVVRWEALLLIKRLDRQAGLEVLLGVARLEDPQISAFALTALGELRYAEAAGPLCDLLKSSKVAPVQKAVAIALGNLGDPKAATALQVIAEKKGFLGLKAAYPEDVRAAAAWALGRLNTLDARAVLERLLNDKSPAVKSAAKMALGK